MYASTKTFAGQRASLGRVAILHAADDDPIEPGVITQIDEQEKEALTITSSFDGRDHVGFAFVETRTEEEVEKLPANSWTWPVRV